MKSWDRRNSYATSPPETSKDRYHLRHAASSAAADTGRTFQLPRPQFAVHHQTTAEKYNEEHKATVIISSHNLNHTVDVCPRIALLEHGVIIRDIQNENNSAEKELEAYFNVSVEENIETENNIEEETLTEE